MSKRILGAMPLTEEAAGHVLEGLSGVVIRGAGKGCVPAVGGFAILASSPHAEHWPQAERDRLDAFAFATGGTEVALSTCSSSSGRCHPEVCGTAILDLAASGDGPILRAEGLLTDPREIGRVLASVENGVTAPGVSPRHDRQAFAVATRLRAAGHCLGREDAVLVEAPVRVDALQVLADATQSIRREFAPSAAELRLAA